MHKLVQADLADLILAVAAEDRAAFQRLYDLAAPKLFAIVLRIIRNRSLAEDILQDVFLRIWRNAGTFSPQAGPAIAWLNAITRNRTIDVLRQKSLTLPEHDGEETDWWGRIAELRDPAADMMDISPLRACLGEIEEPHRSGLLLAYYEGYSREQLALRLEQPVSTVKTWLHRSLAALKTCRETTA